MILATNQHPNGALREASASSLAGLHLAVLFYRFGPYHHARLKAAGSLMRVTGIEFSNVDPTYAWDLVEGADGFKRLTLFSGTTVNELPASRIFNRVSQVLDQLQPQVVAIPGWYDRCSLAALRWCGSHGVPAVVMSETTAWDSERTWLKETMKRRLIKLCASGLVGGNPHFDYLASLGMPKERIFKGYDAVDNDYFAVRAVEVRKRTPGVRNQHGLPENFFLASARFVEKKNLSRLLAAYARYRELASPSTISDLRPPTSDDRSAPWSLVLLGDGPLRSTLNSQLSTLKLLDHVLMPGFKQYDELPVYYGLARAFIHASSVEQWGLVVNEAMASGLPVLVSDSCGCAQDLVQAGVNGFTFDPFKIEQLGDLMTQLSMLSNDRLAAMGQASCKIMADWGLERFASGLQQAVESALRVPRPEPTMFDRLLLRLLQFR